MLTPDEDYELEWIKYILSCARQDVIVGMSADQFLDSIFGAKK